MEKRYDEFSVGIDWNRHHQPQGYALTAGWANEGVAERPISHMPISWSQTRAFVHLADEQAGCAGSLLAAFEAGANAYAAGRSERRRQVQSTIWKLQEELRKLYQ